MFSNILTLLTNGATVGGGLWLVWGAIVLGTSLKDHNGPGIQAGVWQMVGGGVIIAAAQYFGSIGTI